ncbi:hypothetical protein VCHE45_3804 [Vibrio cholerae HE-45]|nr:hypothetical protein VCHE45_3883 [Vibrio cholerae HE-45]EJH67793.1 hypothetical protein VCHE45_3838 [Vibrio cholerae HE-45]EJH67877.1 hypothetical protein VCHE45_3804 [Vibrio cholerae HE-45]
MECSAVSKSQEAIKPRCFNVLDAPHGKFGFTKACIIAVICFSLSRTLSRSQLSLDRFEF